MAQALRIFTAMRKHKLYPQEGHRFSEFEAFIDLALDAYPKGVINRKALDMAKAWSWTLAMVVAFTKDLEEQKLIRRSELSRKWYLVKSDRWYDLPADKNPINITNAHLVIEIFRTVFKKDIIANEYRIKTIAARLEEGRKQTPPLEPHDFKAVFEHKLKEWGDQDDMKKFLTVETLCARKHFQKYLEQSRETKAKPGGGERIQGSIMTAR